MSRFDVYGFIGVVVGLLVGMVGHELSHAWTAVRLGDPTPRMMGRLTLNPKAHADPIGTVVLPAILAVATLFRYELGFFFGYAKPVTIHPGRLRNPKRDAIIVALAGPFFNLAVAALVGFWFRAVTNTPAKLLLALQSEDWKSILVWIVVVNSFLFMINILPIPPLDGSKVLARFLSPSAAMKMEEWSQYFFLFLIVLFYVFKGLLARIAAAIYEPLLGISRFFG